MMKNGKKFTLGLVLGSLSLASAVATPSLRISSGTVQLNISDGGSGIAPGVVSGTQTGADQTGSASVVGADGFNVNGWILTSVSGDDTTPEAPLINFNVKTGAGADLTIAFSQVGITGNFDWTTSMTGLVVPPSHTITTKAYLNSDNTLFSTSGILLAQPATITAGGFHDAPGGVQTFAGPYSFTLEMILHRSTGSGKSFTGQSALTGVEPEVPDGGNTLMLIGSSLAGLSMFGRLGGRKSKA